MREKREESSEEERGGWERGLVSLSIDPPRRSRAHLVFHPSSVTMSLSSTKEKERERERERGRREKE